MAISNVGSAAASAIAATQIQNLDTARKPEEKKPVQQVEVQPAEAKKPASTDTLGSRINTTA